MLISRLAQYINLIFQNNKETNQKGDDEEETYLAR
jgi:hypothetical protein